MHLVTQAMRREPARWGTRTPGGWIVGRVRGVPVILAPSWFLVALVLGGLAGVLVNQVLAPGPLTIAVAAVSLPLLLLASVLVHELAHGAVGHAVGSPPREYVLTLWGGHTQFGQEMRGPGASVLVSVAGPAANAVLAAIAWAAATVATGDLAEWLLTIAAVTNALVAVFNLLPGHPLDGGRVLEAVVWRLTGDISKGRTASAWGGRIVAVGVVLYFFGRPVLQGQPPRMVTVVWVVLLAGHLWQGASQALRSNRARQAAAHVDLRSLAVPAVAVPADRTAGWLEAAPTGGAAVVLCAADGPRGILDPAALAAVPPQARAHTPLMALATVVSPQAVVRRLHGADAVADVALLARAGHRRIVLVADQQVVGLLDVARLEAALARRGR